MGVPLPPGKTLESQFQANLSTVGQAKTPSPWGTYDQGGNVVEVTDSLAPQPPGYKFIRDWRYYHGGVDNAPAYQVEISAFGYDPGDHPLLQEVKPWTGSASASSAHPNSRTDEEDGPHARLPGVNPHRQAITNSRLHRNPLPKSISLT